MIGQLQREFPELRLSFDRPYRELTTLGVGGELPLLAEPAGVDELSALLSFLKNGGVPYFILGQTRGTSDAVSLVGWCPSDSAIR